MLSGSAGCVLIHNKSRCNFSEGQANRSEQYRQQAAGESRPRSLSLLLLLSNDLKFHLPQPWRADLADLKYAVSSK
jgi:hypothetical protein